MAFPKWITPAGNLGIVPELEYYEFSLDAYDSSGGTLVYSLVSGSLPIGIQLTSTGTLKGIPNAGNRSDQNEESKFTIRIRNNTTGNIADRTFNLTVTNIAPPVITPKDIYLGLYLDGTEVNLQLEAAEFTPSANLVWTIKSGEFPPGLELSTDGLISGYIAPIPSPAPGTTPGWDLTPWSFLGWDFSLTAISKTFTFIVEVFDGANYDLSEYTLKVYPRSSLTADNDELPVDTSNLESGVGLTIDYGSKHNPIIITTQADLPFVREGSYFSFNIDAIDIDDDIVNYSVTNLASGAFDEQAFSNISLSYPYIAGQLNNGMLSVGIFPGATVQTIDEIEIVSLDFTNPNLFSGDTIKLLDTDPFDPNQNNLIWYEGTVTNKTTIQVTGSTKITANVGEFVTQVSSGANATLVSISDTIGTLTVIGNTIPGTINLTGSQPTYSLTLTSGVTVNVGDFITQSSTGANATVTANTAQYILFNNTLTTVKGDYITQPSTGANAEVLDNVIASGKVFVKFISGSFNVGSGNISINGSNIASYPTEVITTNPQVSVLYTTGAFSTAINSNVAINGTNVAVYPTTITKIPNTITLQANIGDIITQNGSTGNAIVTEDVTDATAIPVIFENPTFTINTGNLKLNGSNVAVFPTSIIQNPIPATITANIGDFITQPSTGATATVTAKVINSQTAPVQFTSGNFVRGSGNLQINGSNISAYPNVIFCQTNITSTYNTADTFDINFPGIAGNIIINGANTNNRVTSLVAVGVTVGSIATEGTVGFDEIKFDQGTLSLPAGLTIEQTTGWITGQLPGQTVNQIDYEFEIIAYKRDDPTYQDSQIYTLTVLGDLNNRIEWITESNLGSIENGRISDLFVKAISTKGKTLQYTFKTNGTIRLPQGLVLTSTGLLIGRVSFDLFKLDQGTTTIDNRKTTFDNTYTFTVTASDYEGTISSDRTFTIRVAERNIQPYEDLYLKALTNTSQRDQFNQLIQNQNIFPIDLIYRNDDPNFGLAKGIKTLFLPGLEPSTLAEYTITASINHFTKRLLLGEIKTAVVVDSNFNTKYEVVYVEVLDENTSALGEYPNSTQQPQIDNPYYDLNGNPYTLAYPNAFGNMSEVMSTIGFANKGALPDWMTSRQPDGRVLGFTRAVVLAYTVPEASNTIAYRLRQSGVNLNEFDFTVDRYQIDKNYSSNYEIPIDVIDFSDAITANTGDYITQTLSSTLAIILENVIDSTSVKVQYVTGQFETIDPSNLSIAHDTVSNVFVNGVDQLVYPLATSTNPDSGRFITSTETTFDRYPGLSSVFIAAGSVDFAVDISFESINNRLVDTIRTDGGLDGIKSFRDGQTLVFATQEFTLNQGAIGDYNNGWNNVVTIWDGDSWAYNLDTTDDDYGQEEILASEQPSLTNFVNPDDTPGLGWDAANYVPGYNEKLLNSSVQNQRAGIWRIRINSARIVTLEFVQEVEFFNTLYVRNGFTQGGTNIYYDRNIKPGNNVPSYSIVPQEIRIVSTQFDGNGTRFFDNRDEYTLPEVGDKYIKFTKTGVFT